MISASASIRLVTSAPSVSLSPNLISSVTTVSFSLMIGMTRKASRVRQRGARIQVALAIGQIGVRQQHLRGMQAVLAEAALVDLHQAHLAHRGGGLQIVHRSGAFVPAEALHAFGDRAGRNQHDFMSACVERGDLARPVAERLEVQPGALIRHQAAAYLDDDAFAVGQ